MSLDWASIDCKDKSERWKTTKAKGSCETIFPAFRYGSASWAVISTNPLLTGPICWGDNCDSEFWQQRKVPSRTHNFDGSTAKGEGTPGTGFSRICFLPTGLPLLSETTASSSDGRTSLKPTLVARAFNCRHGCFCCMAWTNCSLPIALIACEALCSACCKGTPWTPSSSAKDLTSDPVPPEPQTMGQMHMRRSYIAWTKEARMLVAIKSNVRTSSGRLAWMSTWARNARAWTPQNWCVGSPCSTLWMTVSLKPKCKPIHRSFPSNMS